MARCPGPGHSNKATFQKSNEESLLGVLSKLNYPILPAHRIPASATRQPSTLPPPYCDINWRDYNIPYAPPIQLTNPNSVPTQRLTPSVDFEWICAIDGAYQGNSKSDGYRNSGAAFICHDLLKKNSWMAAKTLLPKASNSAPVSEAEGTLLALQFLVSQKARSALFIHDNFDMHGFICGIRESKKKGSRYDLIKHQIFDLLGKLDIVWCVHVHSHQGAKNLAENTAADQLACLLRKKPGLLDLPPTKFDHNLSTKQNLINAFNATCESGSCSHLLSSNDAALAEMNFPFLSEYHGSICDLCGCPSHPQSTCFFRTQTYLLFIPL